MRFLMKNYGKSVLKKMAETANHSGENPLYCAIRGFNQELIRYLVLELGWNLEADSGTYHGTYIQAGKREFRSFLENLAAEAKQARGVFARVFSR